MSSSLNDPSPRKTILRRTTVQRILVVLEVLVIALLSIASGPATAQQRSDSSKQTDKTQADETQSEASASKPAQAAGTEERQAGAGETEREQKLADYLSGARFSGKFTIDGKEDASPKTEQYTISKCEKLPEPDMYRMTARIKYGETDSEVPLDIKILWSGNTPVITLDSLWIPGMGTFGARVLIHSGRYAGTWQHDAVGGHMFGRIEK
jgi:hypothetical protein